MFQFDILGEDKRRNAVTIKEENETAHSGEEDNNVSNRNNRRP